MTTPKRKAAPQAPRPAYGEPLGRLRAKCIYARRVLQAREGTPEYAAMARALAPALAVIDATPSHSTLSPEQCDYIDDVLNEFSEECNNARLRAMSDARAEDAKEQPRRAAEQKRLKGDATRSDVRRAWAADEKAGHPARGRIQRVAAAVRRPYSTARGALLQLGLVKAKEQGPKS